MSERLVPVYDTTVDKIVFDLSDPLKGQKSVQACKITEMGLITAGFEESSSSSSDEDYQAPKSHK